MLKYKFNVGAALDQVGFNVYKAKKTGAISQDALKKIKQGDTNISLKTINAICAILEIAPGELLEYVETVQDKELKEKIK